MSDDLVHRLRDSDRPGHQGLRLEAADRIEALTEEATAWRERYAWVVEKKAEWMARAEAAEARIAEASAANVYWGEQVNVLDNEVDRLKARAEAAEAEVARLEATLRGAEAKLTMARMEMDKRVRGR